MGSRLNEAFSGVFALLLTVLQPVRGFLGRGRGPVCLSACGRGPGRGWSGRVGGRPARFCPQVQPRLLAVVAFGQVKGQVAAAVAGGPGGHGDQVAADGGGAGFRVAPAGAGAGGAQQVMGDGRDDEPGGVGIENTGRETGERAGAQVGDDLLDDGVVAVLALGLDQFERRVRENGVVAPDGEQLVLAFGCFLVAGADAADDQPRGDLLAFLLRRERRVLDFGDLGAETQQDSWSSQMACG